MAMPNFNGMPVAVRKLAPPSTNAPTLSLSLKSSQLHARLVVLLPGGVRDARCRPPPPHTRPALVLLVFAHPHARTAGQDDDHRQCALQQHGSVTDVLSIGFARHLLAAGAAADQAMESTDRSAGDGDEQEGQDRQRADRQRSLAGNGRGAGSPCPPCPRGPQPRCPPPTAAMPPPTDGC